MNTPSNEQLQLFNTLELPVKSSFYEWEIDSRGAEKPIELSGFKDNRLIQPGYQLRTKAMPTDTGASRRKLELADIASRWRIIEDDCFAIALTMGFPSEHLRCSQKQSFWAEQSFAFEVLTEQYSKNLTTLSQVKPQAESEVDTSQVGQLPQHKQPSPSKEFSTSTVLLGGEKLLEHKRGERSSYAKRYPLGLEQNLSIPCLVKQPKQSEVKGVIRKDEGDRFAVYIPSDGSTITVSKLFVYPDFSKSVRQIENNPRKNTTPSTNNPRKTRRKKGQGNGTIYYRTVTKNGKEYQEAYYHYTDKGKKRTKYIPKKLLDRVKEAESLKLPVGDILILLGGDKKNPRKSSSTLVTCIDEKLNDGCIEQVLETNDLNPRKITPPSNKKRKQGEGTGYIECKPVKKNGKEYK